LPLGKTFPYFQHEAFFSALYLEGILKTVYKWMGAAGLILASCLAARANVACRLMDRKNDINTGHPTKATVTLSWPNSNTKFYGFYNGDPSGSLDKCAFVITDTSEANISVASNQKVTVVTDGKTYVGSTPSRNYQGNESLDIIIKNDNWNDSLVVIPH
jgi:hypothetical protein